MTYEELFNTYYHYTLPNKRRSGDSVSFETHMESNLLKLCDDINNRTLQPTAYTFISKHPKPREVFACDMAMRICHHYIEHRLRPIMEKILINSTFNNRIGKGTIAAVNNLISDIYDVSAGFSNKECWIIKVDMQGYFPNAIQDVAYSQLKGLILKYYKGNDIDDLLYLLQVSIFSYPTLHCYYKSTPEEWQLIEPSKSLFSKDLGIGGAIGHLIWQCAMSVYINDITSWLVNECGLKITVYMDDIAIVTNNKESTLALIPELRRRLSDIGVTLHPYKFYCQHYSKGVEFLGHHIKMGRVYANNRCRRNAIAKIKSWNNCVSINNIDSFVATVNSYLGCFKNCNGYTITQEILKAINHKWWKYIVYDEDNIRIRAKPEYAYRQLIINRFNLDDYARSRRRNRQKRKRNS